MTTRIRTSVGPLAVCLLLALALWGTLGGLSEDANAQGRARFGWMVADKVTVQSGGLDITGDTTLSDVTLVGDMTQSDGDLTVADDFIITAQPMQVVTTNVAFAPTGTYQPISSTARMSPTVTVLPAGTVVHLVNMGANTIAITDTGTMTASGNIVLGTHDTASLLSTGDFWVQTGESDN